MGPTVSHHRDKRKRLSLSEGAIQAGAASPAAGHCRQERLAMRAGSKSAGGRCVHADEARRPTSATAPPQARTAMARASGVDAAKDAPKTVGRPPADVSPRDRRQTERVHRLRGGATARSRSAQLDPLFVSVAPEEMTRPSIRSWLHPERTLCQQSEPSYGLESSLFAALPASRRALATSAVRCFPFVTIYRFRQPGAHGCRSNPAQTRISTA